MMAPHFVLLVSLAQLFPLTLSNPIYTSPPPHSLQQEQQEQQEDSPFTNSVLQNQDQAAYASYLQHSICRDDRSSKSPPDSWVGRLCGWTGQEEETTTPEDRLQQLADETGVDINVKIEVTVHEPLPANCEIMDDLPDSDGNPTIHCDYVGGDFDEWVQNLDKPFLSRKGCVLTPECHRSHHFEAHPQCACMCEGEKVPLLDDRCDGFAGKIPEYYIPITIP